MNSKWRSNLLLPYQKLNKKITRLKFWYFGGPLSLKSYLDGIASICSNFGSLFFFRLNDLSPYLPSSIGGKEPHYDW